MSIEKRSTLTRRDFLKWTGVGTASVAAMLGLAACGEDKGQTTTAGGNGTTAGGNGTTAGGNGTTAGGAAGGAEFTENTETSPIFNNPLFRPGRVDIDHVATKMPTARDTLVIRLDEQPGNYENVSGGYHPQVQVSWILSGCYLLCEGYTEAGVDFGVNKYSVTDHYEYDDDYMGITMHIRDNAFFHNGDPVTAEDVIFCCMRYKDVSRNYFIDFPACKVLDNKTFYIKMNEPNGGGLSGFLGRTVRVFSKKLFEEAEKNGTLATKFMYGNPGTCGMYTVEEWVENDHINYKADHNCYVDPNIENIKIRYISDNTVAMMELTTGTVDLLYSPQSNDIQDVLDGVHGDKIAGTVDYSDMMMMLGMNVSGVLGDINLRKAIIYAVDWEKIITYAWGPLGAAPITPMATTFAHMPDISAWWKEKAPAQIDKAKEFLAKSSHPNGGLELIMDINNEATKVMASEMMNKDLEPLGITLKIVRNDTATWDSMMRDPNGWDLWIRDWGGTGNSWGQFMTREGSLQCCTHCYLLESEKDAVARMTEIGNEYQKTMDDKRLDELAKELWDMYMEDKLLYWFPMTATNHVVLCDAKLRNWYRSTNNWYLGDAYFAE